MKKKWPDDASAEICPRGEKLIGLIIAEAAALRGTPQHSCGMQRGSISGIRNGVLEITLQAPPDEVTRGRRVEITDESDQQK